MDILELALGLLILLFAYLGPFLGRLVSKRGRSEPAVEVADAAGSSDAAFLWPDVLELEPALASPATSRDKPVRRRPRPPPEPRELAAVPRIEASGGQSIDARLISEVVILDTFLSPPRSSSRR